MDAIPPRRDPTARPPLRWAAVAVGVGGLVLAGCAKEPPPLRPTGGDDAGVAESAPAARPTTSAGAGSGEQGEREPPETSADEFAFPADLKVLYRPRPASGNAAGAVRDFGRFWRAWWYASATGGRDTRYRAYVAPGSFLGGTGIFTEVVRNWAESKERPTGTIRAYAVQAAEGDDGRVFLDGCGDETKAGAKNVNTGQVDWSFGKSESSRYKFRVVLARTGDTWQIHEYRSFSATDPAGRECRG
ncbi:hypothetical protein AB0K60_37325 [Thermopolyspora sp. NPDC052614]|uniref:hypothetical protein n=1 Tax=Thermopolyspora sp. NPDC052614 TaxID=3155682 RepID=UPI003448D865